MQHIQCITENNYVIKRLYDTISKEYILQLMRWMASFVVQDF